MCDEIVEDVITTRKGMTPASRDVIKDRSNHFVVLLGEGNVVYGRTYSRREFK